MPPDLTTFDAIVIIVVVIGLIAAVFFSRPPRQW